MIFWKVKSEENESRMSHRRTPPRLVTILKKLPFFGRAIFSYSVGKPPFNINFHWPLCYIRKQVFMSPWVNYFNPGLCAANIRRPGISNVHIRPLRVPFRTLVEWILGDSFLVLKEMVMLSIWASNGFVPPPPRGNFLNHNFLNPQCLLNTILSGLGRFSVTAV